MADRERIGPATVLLWLAILAGLPALVAWSETRPGAHPAIRDASAAREARAIRPPSPPPRVEPLQVYAIDQDDARALNAAIAFSTRPNPAARPFLFSGGADDLARATDCLAAAEIYEAGDDAVGEQAVAQVVLNRVRHPAFPKTVCGVVFQGQERATGCQFTFTCDGALARTPSAAAWERARGIAKAALSGTVFGKVGLSTHYHTDWVVPYWSDSLDKTARVGTHLFFRWTGWWGTPPAFQRTVSGTEPVMGRIARLSSAHQGGAVPTDMMLPPPPTVATIGALAELVRKPALPVGAETLGKSFGAGRLVAVAPGGTAFLMELQGRSAPDSWPAFARTICAGRPQCRIMAWRAGPDTPTGLPLGDKALDAMAFSYIHNLDIGLQRSLWNCTLTPRADQRECMRTRDPVAAAGAPPAPGKSWTPPPTVPLLTGVRRKERFETVKIAPTGNRAAEEQTSGTATPP